MPTSEKRVAANRANAARSTGPRTPGGKEKSSLNAVKHGLTAQASVLPGEDAGQLEALSDSLMKQLKPRGVVQRIVAERIVSIAWKLRRVARAEEAVARQMEQEAIECWKHERQVNLDMRHRIFSERSRPRRRDGATMLADTWRPTREHPEDERLLRLTEYELKLDASLRAGIRELLRLQKDARAFEEVGEEDEAVPAVAGAAPGESGETSRGQNEPIVAPETEGVAERGNGEDDPGPRCAAPAARGGAVDAAEAPVEKTNPLGGGETAAPDGAQVEEAPGVTPDLPAGSSAPAPGTSSSPPPAPRR